MSQITSVAYPRIRKRKDGRIEIIVYYENQRLRLQNGSKFGISLKPNSFPKKQRENQANLLAAQIYSKLLSGFNPLLPIVRNKIKEISDIDILEQALQKKLTNEFSNHYKTQLKYAFYSLKKNINGGTITTNSVEKTLDYFSNPTSYNTMRRSLVVLFNAANHLGWKKTPMKGIRNKRTQANLHKPFEDVTAILKEIKEFNSNLHLCCLLTYGCLLRPHREIRELTWGDFSDNFSVIRLSGKRNKSGRNRVVPVPIYIRKLLVPSRLDYNIFTGDLRAPNPDYFKSCWGRFKKRSKLLKQDQTLYSFRHTGAIDIYSRTGSIEKLKAAMGHSSIIVSLTYLRGLDLTDLKEEDMPKL